MKLILTIVALISVSLSLKTIAQAAESSTTDTAQSDTAQTEAEAESAQTEAETTAPPMPAAAAVCIACHGVNGVSPAPLWPNLAGQKKDYLVKQIQAFRDGTRQDPMMNPLASQLTDADIEAIAQYFSKLK